MARKLWFGLIIFLGMAAWAWADTAPGKIDTGDTAWVLVSAALVMLMTPGLAFFYCGMVARKHVLGTIMQSYALLAAITVQWVLIGYSLSFGPDVKSVIGTLAWFGLKGVGATIGYAVVVSWVLLKIVDATMGLRVTPEEEEQGLDWTQHGESGYNL